MSDDHQTTFEWEVVNHLPGSQSLRHFYYPSASTVGGGDGVMVRVEPQDSTPWFGTFTFNQFCPKGATKVVPLFDGQRLCVVSRGAGYVVSASDPLDWEEVPAIPIIDVLVIPEVGLVIFANRTELLAYGKHRQEWRTRRLAWDGLKITKVVGRTITGEYWDIRDEATRTFEVDVATGASTGGVEDDG